MNAVPKGSRPKFCPKCTALSFGIVWGILILLTGWISMTGWAYNFVDVLSSMYTGYDASFVGGIVGGIWGFFVGAIIGGGFAVVHNRIASR